MRRSSLVPRSLLLLVLSAPALLAQDPNAPGGPSKDALRMGSPQGLSSASSREDTWPAPTAEDWQLPCLIRWQRTFDDALRVAKATGKPVLLCVNMDGEIASEHYAGIRYRRSDTARLYDPYVCVIASVYRHTPRDHDERGNRIECPRFGTVTCGEHIAIEPLLYDKFFDGKRIAPRHIAIETDSRMSYDVYYAWDTATIFTALREGVKDRLAPLPWAYADMPVSERTVSPDSGDRVALEEAYRTGGAELRRTLVESALRHRDVDQVELLRLAIFGFDVELARLARKALAACDSEAAVDLIAEALKVPMEPAERELLLAAAVRLSEKYPRARTLVALHQGLDGNSKWIDVAGWSKSAEQGDRSARGAYEVSASLETRAAATEARPENPQARLELAESLLARAEDPALERRFAALLREDARAAVLRAQELGATGWRLEALLAVTSSGPDRRDAALSHAVAAIEGGMPRPGAGADSLQERTAVDVLALFAEARQRAIAKAYRERTTWPPEWLADVDGAYAVLAQHPLGSDQHSLSYYDFLNWIGATPRAKAVLESGLARFPESWGLHERLRARVLWDQGPDALEAAYTALLARPDAPRKLEWFAGFASIVAAESQRRAKQSDKALAAYGRALEHYARDVERNPEDQATADHYCALALAGSARVALDRGELEEATRLVLASFGRKPEAAATLDGLNLSPVDTAKMLRARLAAEQRTELATRLQAGLDALDPRLLELPAYEREVPSEGARRPPRRRDGGR